MPSLLLASGSPRRSQLLSAAGFDIEIIKPAVVERADRHLTARELTAWNAMRKGLAVARRNPKRVVLAADTVVALSSEVIGKPANWADAIRILRRLSGQTHHVYSSVFIAHLSAGKAKLFGEVSEVRFRKLSDAQIRDYLSRVDPLDKAGAYAAQGYGAEIISRIGGSYSNVVGLPMEQTIAILKQFGMRPARPPNRRSPSPVEQHDADAGVPASGRDKGTKR
jgi:septum formation protein